MKSWKTTILGIISILVVILNTLQSLLDDNPSTVPNWEILITAVTTGIGLIFARDNNVSSEEAGIK